MDKATIEKYVKFIIRGFIYSVILAIISLIAIKVFGSSDSLISFRYYIIMGFYAVYLIINIIKDINIKNEVKRINNQRTN